MAIQHTLRVVLAVAIITGLPFSAPSAAQQPSNVLPGSGQPSLPPMARPSDESPVAVDYGASRLGLSPASGESPAASYGGRTAAIDCLAQAIGYEAGNEAEVGQQAVAQVVLNRLHHRAFPKTVCGVVYQGSERRTGCQFTFTCDGSLRRTLAPRTWDRALRIATTAVDGGLPPTIGTATHYHASYVAPRWAPAMVRLGSIGAHIFYRFPGADRLAGDGDTAALDAQALAATPPPRRRSRAAITPEPFRVWGLAPALSTARQTESVTITASSN